jgi:hypothetical protein
MLCVTTRSSNWIFRNVVRFRAAKFQEPYFLCWFHTADVFRFITDVAAYVNSWWYHTRAELRKLHANCRSLCALKRRRCRDGNDAAGAAIIFYIYTHTFVCVCVCMCLSTEHTHTQTFVCLCMSVYRKSHQGSNGGNKSFIESQFTVSP